MEFETFKENVEKICGLNAQLDSDPTISYLEDEIGNLNFELSKRINHSLRSYFVVKAQKLIDSLQKYFNKNHIDCKIQSAANCIEIFMNDKTKSTYFFDKTRQNLDEVSIPLFHINGCLLELLVDYPDIYEILWNLVEENYIHYETKNIISHI